MSDKLNLDFVKIPAGEFIMGSTSERDRATRPDEFPEQDATITEYYIMRFPVTNEQYNQFIQATGHRPPLFWKKGEFDPTTAKLPVVGVSFLDTLAFCRWAAETLDLPVRLPSEPEWEKAARGTEGNIFPWGNEWNPELCNHGEGRLQGLMPVDKFHPQASSPFSVADTAGNAQEWTSSLYGLYPYDPNDGREALVYRTDHDKLMPHIHETGCVANPIQIEAGLDKHVIRGGSWRQRREASRCAYRSWAAPMHRSDDTGFRCCYEPGKETVK